MGEGNYQAASFNSIGPEGGGLKTRREPDYPAKRSALMGIRVLLADDHQMVRDGLRALLEREPGIEVVGEAENGRMAVQMVRKTGADVVVMDIGMPDLNGIEATRQIVALAPGIKVMALSMHADKRFVGEMFRAGAAAYLLKDCAFAELAGALRVVLAGQVYLTPRIAGTIIKDYVGRLSADQVSAFATLTSREREVLQLLAEGNSVKAIAGRLHISPKTVETHRQQLMHKLDLENLADLVKYAIREGFTSLDGSRH
jgi:DNA-binding NarL/FixJ family response regulator